MIIIQKFGGTSVGTKNRIKFLKNIIKKYVNNKIKIIIILSAMSGETQKMINLAKFFSYKKYKELDFLLCVGEQHSVALFSILLNSIGLNSKTFTSSQINFLTNNKYSNARILNIGNLKILNYSLLKNKIPILTGFQGITKKGNFTTLGRGGSDTSAVAISIFFNAKECQIFTDVNAIFFSDPRICKNFKLKYISFESMLELSSLGSKILYVRSVELAKKYNINIRILSSFSKKKGTFISKKKIFINSMERLQISGITYTSNESKIKINNIPNNCNIVLKILGPIIANEFFIDFLNLNMKHNSKKMNFSFLIENKNLKKISFLIKNIILPKIGGIFESNYNLSKISIIGTGMRSHSNAIGKILFSVKKNNINILSIITSETKISFLIKKKFTIKTIKSLYTIFNI